MKRVISLLIAIVIAIAIVMIINIGEISTKTEDQSSPYNNYEDYGISIFSDTEHSAMEIKSKNSWNAISILEIKSKKRGAIESEIFKDLKIEIFDPKLIAENLKNLKTVNEFSRINERYIIDYDTVNNERVIVEYYDSGIITKNIYNKDTDEMVIVSNASNEKLVIKEVSKGSEFELSDEQLDQIDEALKKRYQFIK